MDDGPSGTALEQTAVRRMPMVSMSGERVSLRRVERQDVEKRVQWLNDPLVQQTLFFDNWPVSVEQTNRWLDRVATNPTRRDFTVLSKVGGDYIGMCGLYNFCPRTRKAGHYVIVGDAAFRGKGYGTDIYKVIVNYGFNELGLNRITGYQLVGNAAAHRVVEKLGWTREGLLRQDQLSHGRLADAYLVSILREDWFETDYAVLAAVP
jgi:RimJ/RimL family protein N-acetyltransferase